MNPRLTLLAAAVPLLFLALFSCSLPLAGEFDDSFDLAASAGTTGENYRIRVFCPDSSFLSSASSLFFVLDGDTQHDLAAAALRDAWSRGLIGPVILVSIGYGRDLFTAMRLRAHDYTPSASGNPDGRVDKFWRFILDELQPQVESRYLDGAAVDPVRVAVGGHSLGGLAAMYALLHDSLRSRVRGYLALSPSLAFGDLLSFGWEAAMASGFPAAAESAALYMAWGASESKFLKMPAAAMAEKLGKRGGLSFRHEEFPFAEHISAVRPGFEAGIRYLFPKGGR